MHIFEKLPRILGLCPIVKFRSTLEKSDPPPNIFWTPLNRKILHKLLLISIEVFTEKCLKLRYFPAASNMCLGNNLFNLFLINGYVFCANFQNEPRFDKEYPESMQAIGEFV